MSVIYSAIDVLRNRSQFQRFPIYRTKHRAMFWQSCMGPYLSFISMVHHMLPVIQRDCRREAQRTVRMYAAANPIDIDLVSHTIQPWDTVTDECEREPMEPMIHQSSCWDFIPQQKLKWAETIYLRGKVIAQDHPLTPEEKALAFMRALSTQPRLLALPAPPMPKRQKLTKKRVTRSKPYYNPLTLPKNMN